MENNVINFHIPYGNKCYEILDNENNEVYICQYWHRDPLKGVQNNGYCSFLGMADWEYGNGHGLLWDAVKECSINTHKRVFI